MTNRRLKEMTRPTTLLLKIPPLLLLKIPLLLLMKILLLLLLKIPLKIRLQATMVLRVKAMETTHPQPEPWSRLPSSSSCSRGSSKFYRISGNETIRKLFARIEEYILTGKYIFAPFLLKLQGRFFKFYRISGMSGNKIIRNFLRILILIYAGRSFRSPSPQTSSKIFFNSTGYPATRLSGTFCED